MSEIINGYILESALSTNNSGFAKWGFAYKGTKDYFIKEFLNPVYPEDSSLFSPRQYEAKKKGCALFEDRKSKLYAAINEAADGNIVCIENLFRCGSKYYIVTEKVDTIDYSAERASYELRQLLCLLLTHSIRALHHKGVVHGDLKLNNIMFCKSTNEKSAVVKLIDFDNSFFEAEPPTNNRDFQIDQIYCAPETLLFLNDEPIELGKEIDVFALGVIFCQIMTGEAPTFGVSYNYLCEAVLDDSLYELNGSLDDEFKAILSGMFEKEPVDRSTIDEVYKALRKWISWCEDTDADDTVGMDSEDTLAEKEDIAVIAEASTEENIIVLVDSERPIEKEEVSVQEADYEIQTDEPDKVTLGEEIKGPKEPVEEETDIPKKPVEEDTKKDDSVEDTTVVKKRSGLKLSSNLVDLKEKKEREKREATVEGGIELKEFGDKYFSIGKDL